MGIIFWMLLRSMLFSVIGNTFYKWFAGTRTGIWFDYKVQLILDKIVRKEDVARERGKKPSSKQLDMFDGDIHHSSKSGK